MVLRAAAGILKGSWTPAVTAGRQCRVAFTQRDMHRVKRLLQPSHQVTHHALRNHCVFFDNGMAYGGFKTGGSYKEAAFSLWDATSANCPSYAYCPVHNDDGEGWHAGCGMEYR